MKALTLTFVIGAVILSCTNSKQGDQYVDEDIDDHVTKAVGINEPTRRDFYLNRMKEKNFQIEINGPCDDALEDTIHERSIAYFDSKIVTDTSAIVEFKFIDACCQEFLGDYSIERDTLKFTFEKVNDVACSCLCWYRYKLTINEPKGTFNDIVVEER